MSSIKQSISHTVKPKTKEVKDRDLKHSKVFCVRSNAKFHLQYMAVGNTISSSSSIISLLFDISGFEIFLNVQESAVCKN